LTGQGDGRFPGYRLPRLPAPYASAMENEHTVVVRRVRAADWRVLKLCRLRALLLDPESFGSSLAQSAGRSEQHWRDLAAGHAGGRDRSILLALDDRAAVGMIRVERETTPDLFGIYSLWVDPAHRRRGLAARLLAEAERWAQSVGAHRAELFVADTAGPALALYEAAGYRPSGRVDDPRHDGVVEVGLEKLFAP
jgi:ribosomal protein S18 acetylase RimI-like enzyme